MIRMQARQLIKSIGSGTFLLSHMPVKPLSVLAYFNLKIPIQHIKILVVQYLFLNLVQINF
jgi:hypothetical protein